MTESAKEEDGKDRMPYELWYSHELDLTHLKTWGCCVLHYNKPDSKLDGQVTAATSIMYRKSDKQYYVLPKEGHEIKLATNPSSMSEGLASRVDEEMSMRSASMQEQ